MNSPASPGRLLRTGRTVARVLITWAAITWALVVLDDRLSGFTLPSWWQGPVMALLLGGVLNWVSARRRRRKTPEHSESS